MMKFSDGVVTGDLMREALVSISQMDTADAVAWLRQTEDTLAVNIQRCADNVIGRLQEQHGLVLTEVQKGLLSRTVVITAITAVTALSSGHYQLWRDFVCGTPLAMFDPLLSIRRRVSTSGASSHGNRRSRGDRRKRTLPGADVDGKNATKFAMAECKPATDTDDPEAKLLLLTAINQNGTYRHEAIYLAEGEILLKALVDGLAKLGSRTARAAWPVVCGVDDKFAPAPDEAVGDGDAGDDEQQGDVPA